MIRMSRLLPIAALAVLSAISLASDTVTGGVLSHERLRVRNTFKTPEEVVGYYCARDASGFVWSGLLDAERTAFTGWREAPAVDSFYIAKSYQVHPSERVGHAEDKATVEVSYDLLATGDAHGTRVPASNPKHKVTFDLARINGQWKIVKPAASEIAPVVLDSKFPYSQTTSR